VETNFRTPLRRPSPFWWGIVASGLWLTALVQVSTAADSTAPGLVQTAENPAPVEESSAAPGDQAAAQSAAQTSAAQSGATYVGDADCATCHTAQHAGYEKTAHNRKADPRTPASAKSCETCHGPASKHVEDPASNHLVNFTKAKPDDVNAVCTSCHKRGEHALWDNSQHEARNLSCTSCHSVHAGKSLTGQLKEERQQDVCATCHKDKVAKLDRSGHMPVREGKMQCSTCHNAHGSTNTKLLRKGDSVAELCTSCHTDKRGPFLWEHAPSRDGCTTCHDPHGSSNERMLVAKPPILCQRCHVATRHPSTIYDSALIGSSATGSVRIFARSCVTCHSAIHGSNHPSGQRFIR
jgi:DmsE family decaheme c-type cytochrome